MPPQPVKENQAIGSLFYLSLPPNKKRDESDRIDPKPPRRDGRKQITYFNKQSFISVDESVAQVSSELNAALKKIPQIYI